MTTCVHVCMFMCMFLHFGSGILQGRLAFWPSGEEPGLLLLLPLGCVSPGRLLKLICTMGTEIALASGGSVNVLLAVSFQVSVGILRVSP